MPTRLVIVPSSEGEDGTLFFNAPDEMEQHDIRKIVRGAILGASDTNGQRSDEVIDALEKSGFSFLGNRNTERVVVTSPWV